MPVGRRPSIPAEVFKERITNAFKGYAIENGVLPSIDDAIAWDVAQDNQPPLPRASVFRRIDALVEGNPDVNLYGKSVAFAGQIGIRSAVEVDGNIYVHQYKT